MNTNVLGAVFRRNLVSYFANPTGYVFICVFVLLGSFAAFWPNEFFNANLANLNQLNLVFPLIMLVFIPAISMAIWADERRQGTDELLLTIPATDMEIVVGKYLAGLAIYSVSLVFSLACNFIVLSLLGSPDFGLLVGTYFGYWLVGTAMLAVGLVASFLTGNLTVAYILGAVFNVPLVFASLADTIAADSKVASQIKHWSIGQQFSDFGRGVITLSSSVYFLSIVVIMLYLCMVLIGRRHWSSGERGAVMGLHYTVRVLLLVVSAVALNYFLDAHDLRKDVTYEQLSSLSPQTRKLLADLKPERQVQVDAFISSDVPESYVQQRLNVLSMLRELQARGQGKIRVQVTPTERFSEEAARAEQSYGITPRQVVSNERGVRAEKHIFMGVAFSSGGTQKVIIPFLDRGIPAEYELVRSLCTVTQQKRQKVGVLQTDAHLYGQMNFQTMQSGGNWPIIDELEKQYEVVQVDPTNPITDKYDVLLAVQPSSLGPEQMDNFVNAVRAGQPTAIFEDPFPAFAGDVPATSAPRMPPGGMNPMMQMMGGGRNQQQPKGDITSLWRVLGVDFAPEQIIWQRYNPYPKAAMFPPEFVIVDKGEGAKEPFNPKDDVSSNLQHMLFPFPGALSKLNTSDLQFTPLVRTGEDTGTVRYGDLISQNPFGPRQLNEYRRQVPTSLSYVMAAEIKGKLKPAAPMADEGKPAANAAAGKTEAPAAKAEPAEAKKEEKPKETDVHVIVVADIDMLSRDFFRLREMGDMPEADVQFNFDNVTFVLNVLDKLAGDERFIDIRKRRSAHRTLAKVEERTEASSRKAAEEREKLMKEYDEAEAKEQKVFNDKIEQLKSRKDLDQKQAIVELAMAQETAQRRMETVREQLKQKRDVQINKTETQLALEVRAVQNQYKRWAVFLPPIPPLLIGLIVLANRRAAEREGVSRQRLRSARS